MDYSLLFCIRRVASESKRESAWLHNIKMDLEEGNQLGPRESSIL